MTISTRRVRSATARSRFTSRASTIPVAPRQISGSIDDLFANSTDETLTQNEALSPCVRSTASATSTFIVGSDHRGRTVRAIVRHGNTMMQSVRERIPELAVLKTYGFSNGAVMGLVFGRSAPALRPRRRGRSRDRRRDIAPDLSPDRRGWSDAALELDCARRRCCGGGGGRERVVPGAPRADAKHRRRPGRALTRTNLGSAWI